MCTSCYRGRPVRIELDQREVSKKPCANGDVVGSCGAAKTFARNGHDSKHFRYCSICVLRLTTSRLWSSGHDDNHVSNNARAGQSARVPAWSRVGVAEAMVSFAEWPRVRQPRRRLVRWSLRVGGIGLERQFSAC